MDGKMTVAEQEKLFKALINDENKQKIVDSCQKNYAAKSNFVGFVNATFTKQETNPEDAIKKLSNLEFGQLSRSSRDFFPHLRVCFEFLLTPAGSVSVSSNSPSNASSLTIKSGETHSSLKTVGPSDELISDAMKASVIAAAEEAKSRGLTHDEFMIFAKELFNMEEDRFANAMEAIKQDWKVSKSKEDGTGSVDSHPDALYAAAATALAKWHTEHTDEINCTNNDPAFLNNRVLKCK